MRNLITPTFLLVAFLLSSVLCFGQKPDSTLIAHFTTIPTSDTPTLSTLVEQITAPYSTKKDQFRSIYLWLTHHVEYDVAALNNKRINQNNQDILDRGKAICWGYATLLKAMCEQVEIKVVVITGYVRANLNQAPFLKYPNHAWNAVQLEGQWQLVDATWDSQLLNATSTFYQKFKTDYYLTNPTYFITNHLPADPKWQLLNCPIDIIDFQQPVDSLLQIIDKKECDSTTPSLIRYQAVNYYEQQLQRAIRTYQFNPTEDNKRDLAHTQIDYQEYLSDKAERLQNELQIDSLLTIQRQMITLCEIATSFTDLFDTQKENCAYNYFNHAVALSQLELTEENEQENLKEMLYYFQLAIDELESLPRNIFSEHALTLSTDYISYLKNRLKN